MKKIGFLIIVMVLFVIDVYADDMPTIKGSLTSTYGVNFDFEEVRAGLKEDFDFDIIWPLIPYEYSEEGENGKFRIETDFTGSLDLTILNQDSEWVSDQDIGQKLTLEISNFYSKIYYDNLYFLVGSKRTGYERQDGYDITRSTDKVRANWAYLTSRVAWSYILNNDYQVDRGSDIINGVDGAQGSEDSIGFGGDTDNLSWIFMFGTKNDWTVDEDNRFDIGYNVSYTGIDSLTINQGTFTRIQNDESIELGAGVGFEYSYPISQSLTLKPNVGTDVFVTDLEETLLKGTEISYGVTLEWPGVSGYGYIPLQENEDNKGELNNHRSSGITIAGINYIDGNTSDDDQFNIKISALDPREGGLVNNLELAALVEIVDVSEIANDEHNLAFGLYADYTILDAYRPKVNAVMRTIDDDRKFPVELSVGVVYVGIPSAEIGIVYENDNLSTIEDKPGRILFSVKSLF